MYNAAYFGTDYYGTQYWPPIEDGSGQPRLPTVGDDYPWDAPRREPSANLLPYFGKNVTQQLRSVYDLPDLRAKAKRAIRSAKKSRATQKKKDIVEAAKRQDIFEGSMQAQFRYEMPEVPKVDSLEKYVSLLAIWEARHGMDPTSVEEYMALADELFVMELDRLMAKRKRDATIIALLLQ